MNKQFICIEGNIGAGKTTLANKLAEHYQAKLLLENFEDNPYLKDFYIDTRKFALQVELSFLADRYQQQLNYVNEEKLIVSDYLFDKTLIFAGINLNTDELKVFKAAFLEAKCQIRKPDVIVFLDAKEDLLERNIKKRGRNFEENIPSVYLQKVTNAYHTFLKNKSHDCPVIWVNANEFDLISNEGHFKYFTEFLELRTQKNIHFL